MHGQAVRRSSGPVLDAAIGALRRRDQLTAHRRQLSSGLCCGLDVNTPSRLSLSANPELGLVWTKKEQGVSDGLCFVNLPSIKSLQLPNLG